MRNSRRNSINDLLRRILFCCLAVLSSFTLSNLNYIQRTLEYSYVRESLSFNFAQSPPKTPKDAAHGFANDSTIVSELPCLVHQALKINASQNLVSDPSKTSLKQNTSICGRLKRQWLHNPPLSPYARMIEAHQTNCSLPLATHHFDNTFGLGAHFVLWGQAICNAMEDGLRMHSFSPDWLWLDQHHCDMEEAKTSPMLCYFPDSESRCSKAEVFLPRNVSDPRRIQQHCQIVKESSMARAEFRAAATEYIFQSVSPLIIQEAKRQIGIIFPEGVAPSDLISVHIRWGKGFTIFIFVSFPFSQLYFFYLFLRFPASSSVQAINSGKWIYHQFKNMFTL